MKKGLMGFVVGLSLVAQVQAVTVYVDVDSTNPISPYSSWATAATTIQDAVDASADGDTVLVADGTYSSGGAVTPGYALSNRVCITQAITVQSVNGPELTIIQGAAGSNGGIYSDAVRGVFLTNTCSLIGFTVSDGYSSNGGDTHYDRSAGGVWMTTNCVVSNCVISANVAQYYGSGVYLHSGGLLIHSILSDNGIASGGSYYGGGACTWYEGTLDNCLLINNSSANYGGGACLYYGGTMNNCTASGNVAGYGGGCYTYNGTVNNSIMWGNSASQLPNLYKSGSSVIRFSCASEGLVHGVDGCTTNNALFVGESSGDYRLSASSPCINTGSNAFSTVATDLVENSRIIGGTVDMGVYESPDLPSYAITTTAGSNGSIDPVNPQVFQGYDQAFSIQPAFGYYLDSLTVDGSSTPLTPSYTFNNVQSSHTISATFATDPHTLVVEQGTGDGSYIIHTEVPVVADTPVAGYGFSEWTVEPTEYMDRLADVYSASTIFTMPETNVVLTAHFGLTTAYVDAARPDDSGDGMNWATAKQTIQAAVDATASGGTVWVTNGTYGSGYTVAPGRVTRNRVCILKPIVVRSVNGPDFTVIEGAVGSNGWCDTDSVRGAFLTNGCSLVGFAITNGYTSYSGDSFVDMSGGGIWMSDGCVVSDSTVHGCRSGRAGGGAMLFWGGSVVDCSLEGNRGDGGGGAYIYNGGTMDRCTVKNNRSGGSWGGGIKVFGSGTMYPQGIINNCLVIDNDSQGAEGGGIWVQYGKVNNCTITRNQGGNGGGVRVGGYSDWLNNSVVWGNTASSSGADVYDAGNGRVNNTCSSSGLIHGTDGCITNNPLFMDAGIDDFRLQMLSACIEAGDNSYAPAGSDLIGNVRIVDGTVDMGAYESTGLPIYTIATTAGENGSISPENPDVRHGDDQVFSILSDPKYHIDSLLVDGVPVVPTSSVSFISVQATHTVAATFAANTTLYVDASRPDDSGDGTSWALAKQTIQAAVDAAFDGGTVWVTNGVYDTGGVVAPGQTFALSRVCITNSLTLISVNGASDTIIEGAPGSNGGIDLYSTRGVYLARDSALIGFTVTNGYGGTFLADENGGGIWMATNCIVSNCTVRGNFSEGSGGGIWMSDGASVSDCLLSGNSASSGGGAYLDGGGLLNKCILTENSALNSGGGARLASGGTLDNCLIIGNTADATYGGGVSLYLGGTLNNCTLSGNAAPYGGGASLQHGGELNNCVVWDNTASTSGQDIYRYSTVFIRNTCASDGAWQGTDGCITNNPVFVDGTNGDFQLQKASPCINAGDNLYVSAETDLLGNPRINAGTVDMGVYENTIPMYLIETTAGSNGSISPQNPMVFQGDDQVFAIEVLPGHRFETLAVDGLPLPVATSYTFVNVQTNHNISATFAVNDLLYVDASMPDDSGNGASWVSAKKTIQAAVDAVINTGRVVVANGIYSPTGRVVIAKDIRVESLNGATATTVDGGGASRGFTLGSQECVISGFTITNCTGSGVWCDSTSPVIEHCIITGNSGGDGGGIHKGTANHCVISGNSASDDGGGIYAGNANHCTISDNSAVWGGGLHLWGDYTANYCLIQNNTAENYAGGVWYGTLNNCTIIYNQATTVGSRAGGTYTSTMNNCIVWYNTAQQIGDNIWEPVEVNNSCSPGYIGASSPDFIGGGDYHLQATSICVDGGSNLYLSVAIDLDGIPIPLDGDTNGTAIIDIGCYEFIHASADTDVDGLTDADELDTHGTDPTNENTDGDSIGDGDEAIAGTDPLDPTDYFQIAAVDNSPEAFTVYFHSLADRQYQLFGCSNVVEGFWFAVPGGELRLGSGGNDSMTDANPASAARYYRLEVSLP